MSVFIPSVLLLVLTLSVLFVRIPLVRSVVPNFVRACARIRYHRPDFKLNNRKCKPSRRFLENLYLCHFYFVLGAKRDG